MVMTVALKASSQSIVNKYLVSFNLSQELCLLNKLLSKICTYMNGTAMVVVQAEDLYNEC